MIPVMYVLYYEVHDTIINFNNTLANSYRINNMTKEFNHYFSKKVIPNY